MAEVIEGTGLMHLPHGWVKSLGGKLWELRITGKDGIARAIYVTASGQRKGGRMKAKLIGAREIHEKEMARDPAYRAAYEGLEEEFVLVNSMIRARARADLSQAEVARRMGTTESAISRLESGRGKPSTRTLERYAKAVGHRLRITLEPTPQR